MNKKYNPKLLNTVVSGTGMKYPRVPSVIIGDLLNGYVQGDLMDANAILELLQEQENLTQELNETLADYTTTEALTLLLADKQDTINDLSDIRSGAAAGATALQSFTETDPTVPQWAKQSTKPSYTAQEVDALPNTTKYGSTIDLAMDSATYVLTLSLKDQDGTVLNTKTVDLPIESVVVNGTYDDTNKKVILTLQSGSTIDVPVGDLIAGLQTEITSVNMLDADLVDDTNSTHKFVTLQEKQTWNNKSDFSGSYNDLSDKPTIPAEQIQSDWNQTNSSAKDFIKNKPTIPVIPTNVSTFSNDAGYLTQQDFTTLDNKIETLAENTEALLGAEDMLVFDATQDYNAGDMVMYDEKLYKFTAAHPAGAWIGTDAIVTNLVKEIDQMSKLDYEQVAIDIEDEQGQSIEDVEVVVDVEGETSARNLITDAQGRCTTNVQKGLEYTVEVNTPAGYQHTGQIWHRASLPTRVIPIVLLEDTTSQYEHLKVTLSYSDSSLGVADHILVSYDGVDYSVPVVNNVAEYDIPLGKTYTVRFPDIEGYVTPRPRTRTAEFSRVYAIRIWYQAAVAGIRWMMNDGSEKELNEATYEDYASNSIFGLIVNTSELANANCGYIIPWSVMIYGAGNGTWLSINEEVPTMSMFASHAAALTDIDGEQNCERIREYIANQAAVGVTRTSGIAQTVYNRCGGIGVTGFATNVDYAVGDLVLYNNMIYRFTTAHKGNWNAAHVEKCGVGYIMPSGELQRCFQVAYGQIYAYRLVIGQVRNFMSNTFGVTALNVASGPWWSSTQFNVNNGVNLFGGSFGNFTKSSTYALLPVLAY